MDQIIPGLWIGDLACALATDYLVASGTTHIVTALKQGLPTPIKLPDGRTIDAEHVYHVNIDDVDSAPILVHFPGVIEFIDAALQHEWLEDEGEAETKSETEENADSTHDNIDAEAAAAEAAAAAAALRAKEIEANSRTTPPPGRRAGQWATMGEGTVLVHCHAGISRSVAIVVAYLMYTRQMSVQSALALVRSRRSIADPNPGFMHQLELFESAAYTVDVRNQRIRRFLMSQASILRGDPIDDVMLSYYPSPLHSPASSTSGSLHIGGSLQFSTLDKDKDKDGADRAISSGSASPTQCSSGRSSAAMSRQTSRVAASSAAARGATERHNDRRRSETTANATTANLNAKGEPAPSLSSSSPTSPPVDLSKSPPMPDRSYSLFDQDDDSASSSKRDEDVHKLIRERFTSVNEPHEVMITVNSGNLPGGVSKVRGNQTQASQRGNIVRDGGNGKGTMANGTIQQQRLPKPHFGAMKLRCRMCRRELAAQDHVVEHEAGRGKDAFDVRKRAKDVEQKSRDGRAAVGQTVEEKFGARQRQQSSSDENYNSGEKKDDESITTANAVSPSSQSTPSAYKSAASLSAQLPPHLAALRLGARPQPATSAASEPLQRQSAATVPVSAPAQASVDLRKMLHSPVCSAYFVEPLAWMSALQLGEVAGRLDCPNARCGAKLGSWDWAGMQCACGAWVTPAFALHRSKVDEV